MYNNRGILAKSGDVKGAIKDYTKAKIQPNYSLITTTEALLMPAEENTAPLYPTTQKL